MSHFSSRFNLQTEELLTDLQLPSPHEYLFVKSNRLIIILAICAASLSYLGNT